MPLNWRGWSELFYDLDHQILIFYNKMLAELCQISEVNRCESNKIDRQEGGMVEGGSLVWMLTQGIKCFVERDDIRR